MLRLLHGSRTSPTEIKLDPSVALLKNKIQEAKEIEEKIRAAIELAKVPLRFNSLSEKENFDAHVKSIVPFLQLFIQQVDIDDLYYLKSTLNSTAEYATTFSEAYLYDLTAFTEKQFDIAYAKFPKDKALNLTIKWQKYAAKATDDPSILNNILENLAIQAFQHNKITGLVLEEKAERLPGDETVDIDTLLSITAPYSLPSSAHYLCQLACQLDKPHYAFAIFKRYILTNSNAEVALQYAAQYGHGLLADHMMLEIQATGRIISDYPLIIAEYAIKYGHNPIAEALRRQYKLLPQNLATIAAKEKNLEYLDKLVTECGTDIDLEEIQILASYDVAHHIFKKYSLHSWTNKIAKESKFLEEERHPTVRAALEELIKNYQSSQKRFDDFVKSAESSTTATTTSVTHNPQTMWQPRDKETISPIVLKENRTWCTVRCTIM